MQGLLPPGPLSGISKLSHGPWFKEVFRTDDGLEYYYKFKDREGETRYLLTNNIPWEDRERLWNLYQGHNRANKLATLFGFWASVEMVTRIPQIRRLAVGWKVLSFLGLGCLSANLFTMYG